MRIILCALVASGIAVMAITTAKVSDTASRPGVLHARAGELQTFNPGAARNARLLEELRRTGKITQYD
jgi:hypothetical protein